MATRGNAIAVRITPTVQHKGGVYNVFPSMTECARELHIQESHISEVCSGKRKSHHGYYFSKVSKTEAEHKFICCLCGKETHGYGNDPWPLDKDPFGDEECCDICNEKKVIPARLRRMS